MTAPTVSMEFNPEVLPLLMDAFTFLMRLNWVSTISRIPIARENRMLVEVPQPEVTTTAPSTTINGSTEMPKPGSSISSVS